MLVVNEELKIEYETKEEREKHITKMKDDGYKVVNRYISIDIASRNHIYAEFTKQQKGYVGTALFTN